MYSSDEKDAEMTPAPSKLHTGRLVAHSLA